MLMILVALMPLPVLIWAMLQCHRTGTGYWFVAVTFFPASILSFIVMAAM